MPKLNGMAGPYPQKLVDRFVGENLLIVAGGRCVWDDLALFGCRGDTNNGWHVMCINDVVMHYPGKVDHFYTNDHRMMQHWLASRRPLLTKKYGTVKYTHSCRVGGKYSWPWPGHGTSGLNAVYTGLAMGYDQIVLCGMPLDNSGHYFEPPWVISNFEREVGVREDGTMMYWHNANQKLFGGKVKSMSGRTRELLGAP